VREGATSDSASGRSDTVIMRVVDVLYARPSLLFVIIIMTYVRGVDVVVPVNEAVAKADDLAVIGDAADQVAISPIEADQGFADDLEVALHGRPREAVVAVVSLGASARQSTDERPGGRDVVKRLS